MGMSNKKNNARVQKWRTMLNNGLFKDTQLLHSRVRKGIPPSMRNVAWPDLVKLRKHIEQRSVDIKYETLINSLSKNVYEISLDIPRTFPEEQQSKTLRKSLNNVLKAIAIVHPRVGYCQGMNFLALRILQVLNDQQSFWLLDYLFINDSYLINNFIDPKHIEFHNHNFEILLNECCPGLHKSLTEKGIHLHAYTMKCFMTLFSAVVRQEFFNRIFEVYLLQGWSIIYSVALVFFMKNQQTLRKSSMEQIHLMLGKRIFDSSDIDELMNDAYSLNITASRIQYLQKRYNSTLRESANLNRMSASSDIRRREQNNKTPALFIPQQESTGTLTFQNKAEEVNFDALYILRYTN